MINQRIKQISILVRSCFLVLSTVLVLSACTQKQVETNGSEESGQVTELLATSNSRIHSGYEESLRFRPFKTFNFSGPTEVDKPDISELLVLQFSAAVEEQMLKRGYSKSDNPDVLINISVDLKDATSAPKISRTWTSGSGVCPSYRFYNGGPRAPSSSGSMPTLCEFKEGSVRVDMVVVKLSRAMWSGVSLVRIDKDEARSNVISQRTLLSPIIADTNIMFENYPFRFHQEIDGLPKDS